MTNGTKSYTQGLTSLSVNPLPNQCHNVLRNAPDNARDPKVMLLMLLSCKQPEKKKKSLSYVINYQEKQVILFRVFTCAQNVAGENTEHLMLGFSHFFVSHTSVANLKRIML